MNNNDILRRLRYTFDFSDEDMMALYGLAAREVTRELVVNWLKREADPGFQEASDLDLSTFLNGWIIKNRGKREGPPVPHEKELNNNVILRKIKIALMFKDDDMMDVFDRTNSNLSKHELSAFFRKPGQRQYRDLQDQFLRNFLQGLQQKIRNDKKK